MTEERLRQQIRFEKILKDSYVDAKEDIPEPPIAISKGKLANGEYIPIGTYGNFSFISAGPKSKKTFLVSLLAASYLGSYETFVGNLKGFKGDKKVIHYDTEQSRYHAQKTFKRVHRMSKDASDYLTYALRQFSPEERLEFIDWHLKETDKVGLVIIDGVADLLNDINDLEKSNKVIHYLMKWTLEKKTETQITVTPTEDNPDVVVVDCKRSRGYAFSAFSFEVKSGLPQICKMPDDVNDFIHP